MGVQWLIRSRPREVPPNWAETDGHRRLDFGLVSTGHKCTQENSSKHWPGGNDQAVRRTGFRTSDNLHLRVERIGCGASRCLREVLLETGECMPGGDHWVVMRTGFRALPKGFLRGERPRAMCAGSTQGVCGREHQIKGAALWVLVRGWRRLVLLRRIVELLEVIALAGFFGDEVHVSRLRFLCFVLVRVAVFRGCSVWGVPAVRSVEMGPYSQALWRCDAISEFSWE